MKPKAIVLRTAGTNCDYETAFGVCMAGFDADLVHVNELIRGNKKLDEYDLLVIPGGFSHGDYLGSGKVLANKLAYKLNNKILEFIGKGNLVIGICNGFQVLVKAGILPGFDGNYKEQNCTLSFNNSGHFQCEWVKLRNVDKGKCVFTKGIKELAVPIAHGEGKFIPANDDVLKRLQKNGHIVFKYVENPNGSVVDIAGICDETGRVFGMMPHPERNIFGLNAPNSSRDNLAGEGEGLKIFRNVYDYLKE